MSRKRLDAKLRRATPVFAALGDDMRLHIVARLSAGGPLSITRLAEGAPITRQAVTKHLHVLEEAGLVKGERSGREQFWELKPDSIAQARECLGVISTQWNRGLNRLKAFVEDDGK